MRTDQLGLGHRSYGENIVSVRSARTIPNPSLSITDPACATAAFREAQDEAVVRSQLGLIERQTQLRHALPDGGTLDEAPVQRSIFALQPGGEMRRDPAARKRAGDLQVVVDVEHWDLAQLNPQKGLARIRPCIRFLLSGEPDRWRTGGRRRVSGSRARRR